MRNLRRLDIKRFVIVLAISTARVDLVQAQTPGRPGPVAVICFDMPVESITGVALSPDGSLLAIGNGVGELTVRQTKDGRLHRKLRNEAARPFRPDPSLGRPERDPSYRGWPLFPIVFDPSGTVIALVTPWGMINLSRQDTGHADYRPMSAAIEVWNVDDGRKLVDINLEDSAVSTLGFDRPGGRLVAIDTMSRAITWDVATGRRLDLFGTNANQDTVRDYITSSPEATWLGSGAAHAVSVRLYEGDPQPAAHLRLWDRPARTLRLVDPEEQGWIGPGKFFGAVTLTSDARLVAAAASDGMIHLIDFAQATPSGRFDLDGLPAQSFLAFRPDDRALIAISSKGEIRVYHLDARAPIWSARGVAGDVRAVRWSGDRVLVVTSEYQVSGDGGSITLSAYAIPPP